MSNSTQNAAKYRNDYKAPEYTITKTELVFELHDTLTKVSSSLLMQNIAPGSDLVLDSNVAEVKSVSINSNKLNDTEFVVDQEKEKLLIPWSVLEEHGVATHSQFTIDTVSIVNPKKNLALEGLYKAGEAFCTQCEAEGFRKITPYLDRPDVLSEFFVIIKGDNKKYPQLLCNGNLTSDELDENEGIRTVKWHDPFPKPSYLFALVAGDFDSLKDTYVTASGRTVNLEIYVDKGNLHLAPHAMSSLKKSMQWDEVKYGLEYDLDTYMIVAVDFFNMGAMENKGLNVFNSKYVLADENTATDTDFHGIEAVIGHEYFHNWTGNRVTCRDWFQLSLKEGLTVFRDQQFSADMGDPVIERISHANVIRTHQFAEDAGPMSHPIRPDKVVEMNNFYTVTVYDKGAEVIRMMHTLLGEEDFRKGMDLYFERHDGQAVTCDDFVAAMADANDRDLEQFSRWYSQAGTPEVMINEHSVDGKLQLEFSQSIKTADTEPQPLVIPVKYELLSQSTGRSIKRDMIILNEQNMSFSIDIEEPVDLVLFENFSAPVKVKRDLSLDAMSRIVRNASDGFSRWDMMQQVWSKALVEKNSAIRQDAETRLIELYQEIMDDSTLSANLKACLLGIPSFQTLAGVETPIDVDKILSLIERVSEAIAKNSKAKLLAMLSGLEDIPNGYDPELVGQRALKAAVLKLIGSNQNHTAQVVIQDVYRNARNMTEKNAALSASFNQPSEFVEEISENLASQFDGQPLVLDKALQAIAVIPSEEVYVLMEKWASKGQFDRTNPNRMRALYGSFVMRNPIQFHDESGKGYEFLSELLLEVDKVNPQLAARLVDPLLAYKRYLAPRSELMLKQIKRLNDFDLSKDLSEKVSSGI